MAITIIMISMVVIILILMMMILVKMMHLQNSEDDGENEGHLENPEDAHHPDQPDHLPCSPNHLIII